MEYCGEIFYIKIKDKETNLIKEVKDGFLKKDIGLYGDSYAGKGIRQISLVGIESIENITADMKKGFCFSNFKANITTKGIDFTKLKIGSMFYIGDAVLEVVQTGKDCYIGCANKKIVPNCEIHKKCAFAQVIKGGKINVGDKLEVFLRDFRKSCVNSGYNGLGKLDRKN